MSKRGAVQTTLVHLLVVLSLVIESEQVPRCFGGRSDMWLWRQLDGILSPDLLLDCLKKVSGKSGVAIGRTNVKELIHLSKITLKECNDATYKAREEVCQKAKIVGNDNVNEYCKNRLIKLTWFCAENAPDYHGIHINPSASSDMVNYFLSLFKDYGSEIIDKSEILDLVMDVLYAIDIKKSDEMKTNCLALKRSRKQSGAIRDPSEQSDGNQLEANLEGPNWANAYNLCKVFFERTGMSKRYQS